MRSFIAMAVPLGVAAFFLAGAVQVVMRRSPSNRPSLAAQALYLLGVCLVSNVAYPWWRTGLMIRVITVLVIGLAGLLSSYAALRGISSLTQLIPLRPVTWGFALLGVGLLLVGIAIVSWPIPSGVALALPVSDGTWYVAHGGPLNIINHHRSVIEQQFGLDLTRLPTSNWTAQAKGATPSAYPSWGSAVIAPIDGVVVSTVGGLPDMDVGVRDTQNPAGNCIVLKTSEGVHIVIAHLQQDSILVDAGQRVRQGDVLGKVGNSGQTTEPHIHIHAMTKHQDGAWVGIPIYMNGRSPRRGHLLKVGR